MVHTKHRTYCPQHAQCTGHGLRSAMQCGEYYVAEYTITGSGIMEDMSFHGPDLDR